MNYQRFHKAILRAAALAAALASLALFHISYGSNKEAAKEAAMLINTLPVGQLESNCYIIHDPETNKAVIIDPGDEPDRILEQTKGMKVEYLILTHGHFDHIGAIPEIKKATGAKIVIHESEVEIYEASKEHAALWGFKLEDMPDPDVIVVEGDEILSGNMSFAIIHTPGHTPGAISLYTGEVVITGDTLFAGSVGRTDFPGGSLTQLKESFRKLMRLPEDTAVLPGHGPATTIGREMTENMFAPQFLND